MNLNLQVVGWTVTKTRKAIPLQAWTGPDASGISKSAHESGKIVSPRHRPHLPLGNIPGTHFC